MADRPPQTRLVVWRSFLEAHSRITQALGSELAAERGLSPSWYAVLSQLSDAGGTLRMQELARRMLLAKSSLTRLVERMEVGGLVERQAAPDDRRGTLAVLTTPGRAALRRAAPVHLRGIEEHFASKLDGRDVSDLKRILGKLTADG